MMAESRQLHLIVASNICRLRQNAGLSQESFADKCNLHRTYIGAIERGERNITVNTLARIAEALNINPADLLIDKHTEEA